jgi:hypothetical protein
MLCIPCLGIHYRVVSLSATGAVVAYSLDSLEISAASPQRAFVFAISSQPGAVCVFSALGEKNGSAAAQTLDCKPLASGWAGPDFLQWCRFNPYLQTTALIACPRGDITVRFSSAIIVPGPLSTTSVRSAIVRLPLQKPLRKTQAAPALPAPFRFGIRMDVNADGIYTISANALQKLGVPVSSIPSKTFKLFCNNLETPLYITNSQRAFMAPNDSIFFYGKFLRAANSYFTQFSYSNVYWLTWSDAKTGLRVSETSGAQLVNDKNYQDASRQTQLAARDFYDTVHLEQDNDIRWLGSVDAPGDIDYAQTSGDSVDNWYWGFIGQDFSTDYPVSLPPASSDPNAKAVLRVGFMGLTAMTGVTLDHNLRVMLNNNPIGDTLQLISWKGQSPYVYTSAAFPVSRIQPDQNVVTFLRESNFTDLSALNWIEFQYYRSFAALNDKIWFKNNPLDTGSVFQFEITGFTAPPADLWDLSSNRLVTDFEVRRVASGSKYTYSLVFQDSLRSVSSYFAQTAQNRLTPDRMRLDTIAAGWDTIAKADYIVVTVDSFIPPFKPLCDAYKKRGLSVATVDISDVYNSFSAGIRDPESIRSFIRYIFSIAGIKPPRYLLLGGDTTHDLDKNGRRDRNIVPTHLSRVPGWGPSSDDGYFTLASGNDNFPDMCVGRFPAENKTELQSLVAKTVNYLTHPFFDAWRDNMLMAGGLDADFTQFNDQMTTQVIGPAMNILRMDADTSSKYYKNEFTASQSMADFINAGVYALNFVGHGGGNIWSDSRFFGYDDLDKLYNGQWGKSGKLPFVFSFTCLTGFFESAFYRSLGEEFIRQNGSGALCFFGASAYTSKQANLIMDRILLDYAVNGQVQSIGELIWLTKMNMLARFGNQYLPIVRQYNLLGDPALPWSLAPDSLKLTLANSSLTSGDTLKASGTCTPLVSGKAVLSVAADGHKWDEAGVDIMQKSIAHSFLIKDSVTAKTGTVRAFAWNDSQDIRGWAGFSKDAVPIQNVALSKEPVRFGDSISVTCSFTPPDTLASVALYCMYGIAQEQNSALSFAGASMTQTSKGQFASPAFPVIFSGRTGDILFVKFRVSYSRGTARLADTSHVYSFNIRGCPDLVFTTDTLRPVWFADSVRVNFEVLNAGNAASPPFLATFYGGSAAAAIALCSLRTSDSLGPGKARTLSVALPDTQGLMSITATLNPGRSFLEISYDNNSKTCLISIRYRDMKAPADTLFSMGKGLAISPLSALALSHRVFLFSGQALSGQPLKTESSWTVLRGDSLSRFYLGARPMLSNADSLAWTFFSDTTHTLMKNKSAATGKMSAMTFDSAISSWRSAGGNWAAQSPAVCLHSVSAGPYALAALSDVSPPQIRTSVNGRELDFLDYAAKGKPFNIMLGDASGVWPGSIKVLINHKALDGNSISRTASSSDLGNLTITAFPAKQNSIDSMSIYAQDLAGNATTAVFAYMPGEDLAVKFFECHPNPFTAKQDASGNTIQTIRFAFLLTDVARDVSITIFTISSRVVWKWDKTGGTIGYQEVEWNGKTSSGARIANGTYYAKLTAVNDSKKVTKNIRIAKLEGY